MEPSPDRRDHGISIAVPDAVLDEIVERVVARVGVRERSAAEQWVGVNEVAAHLACRRQRIYDLVSRRGPNRIPHRRDGTRLLFRLSEVDAWLHGPR